MIFVGENGETIEEKLAQKLCHLLDKVILDMGDMNNDFEISCAVAIYEKYWQYVIDDFKIELNNDKNKYLKDTIDAFFIWK